MTEPIFTTIPPQFAGQRLDKVLAQILAQYSRSRLQSWLKAGDLLIDNARCEGTYKVMGGEAVALVITDEPEVGARAEPVALEVIYEDADIVVINKPAGMVVHPAAGNWHGTMLNGLLHWDENLASIPRGGIVHRLDKDTSGLLVVARSHHAHNHLVAQLQARTMGREYQAICCGNLMGSGRIVANIGRHSKNRQKMAVLQIGGKVAITNYHAVAQFRHHTLVRCKLETGRTHQIRVHLSHLGFPLLGDPAYNKKTRIYPDLDQDLQTALNSFKRQALHAAKLQLTHPTTGKVMRFRAPLPDDFADMLALLEDDYFADALHFGEDEDDDWNEDDYDVEVIYEP